MNPLSAAIGAGASLLGSAYTAHASAKEAKRNRQFQERMSNTAHQRAAEDLKLAGLNRILAFGSPASTPGGAVGQVPDFGQSLASGAQAGIGYASTAQSIDESTARINKLVEETNIKKDEAFQSAMKTKVWKALEPVLDQTINNAEAFMKAIDASGMAEELQKAMAELPTQVAEVIGKLIAEAMGLGSQPMFEKVGPNIFEKLDAWLKSKAPNQARFDNSPIPVGPTKSKGH